MRAFGAGCDGKQRVLRRSLLCPGNSVGIGIAGRGPDALRGGTKAEAGLEVSSSVCPLVRRESHDTPRCNLTQRHVSSVNSKGVVSGSAKLVKG